MVVFVATHADDVVRTGQGEVVQPLHHQAFGLGRHPAALLPILFFDISCHADLSLWISTRSGDRRFLFS